MFHIITATNLNDKKNSVTFKNKKFTETWILHEWKIKGNTNEAFLTNSENTKAYKFHTEISISIE